MNNKYDDVKIGERIQQARKETKKENGRSLSLENVSAECGASRQLISKWESGDLSGLSLNDLTAMSNLFQCDVSFLLCEHDTKRRATIDVHEVTGLSIKAIEKISDMNRHSTIPVEVLSRMLEHPEIEAFLHKIYEFAWTESAYNQLKDMEKVSKVRNLPKQGIIAGIAKQDVEEIRDSKEFRVTKLFGNIFDAIVKRLTREKIEIYKLGADMVDKALHPEEQKKSKQGIYEMIAENLGKED